MSFTCLDVVTAAGLEEGRRVGKEQAFRCPCHDDAHPSLRVNADKDVWMCGPCGQKGTAWQLAAFLSHQAPDDKASVTAWLREHGLLNGNGQQAAASSGTKGTKGIKRTKETIACTYPYRDARGEAHYESVRYVPKRFGRRRPDGRGGWIPNLDGVSLVPYALDRLVDRTPDVFLCEGEKDCEALWARGIPATTNIGGAAGHQWFDTYSEQLQTLAGVERACILPDHDVPGHRHAQRVAESLHRVGIEPHVVHLPGLHDGPPAPAHGRDVSDWLETHTITELTTCAAAAPRWTPPREATSGLDPALLEDVTVVVAEGQRIAQDGVPMVVETLIPALGVVGALVAYTKVGKTTFAQHLAGTAACGTPFLDLATRQVRVLNVAAEDPPEYTAYTARHLAAVPKGQLTFYRHPIQLDAAGLAAISATVKAGSYGLVLISSWQSVVATLIKDENDNAGSVRVMDAVKAAARATGIPWLIDAHSGKGEDQSDDADPTRAMRGASAAAGAADFLLSLRYADGPFSPKRRFSGKGRFVSFAPILMAFDPETGSYTALGTTKTALVESTWRMIVETGALTTTPQGATSIAVVCGLAPTPREVTGSMRRQIDRALRKRPGVRITSETRGDRTLTKYAIEEPSPE